jgi:hypothetical protein
LLEYIAQRAVFTRQRAAGWESLDERLSVRSPTLLNQWLRGQPLNAEDCEAFAIAYTEQRLFRPELIWSLIQQWQTLAPESALPLELSTWMPEPPPPAQTRVLELTSRKPKILESTPDLDFLRRYAQQWLDRYRALRSILHLPATGEITPLLQKLIELDSARRREHQLNYAELLWDARQDDAFLDLARQALGLDHGYTPTTTEVSTVTQAAAFARMVETCWSRGDLVTARNLVDQARLRGLLDRDEPSNRWLRLVVRKVALASSTALLAN